MNRGGTEGSYRRVLGIADLFAVGYGDVGSSIYYALGIVALFSLGGTPLSFAIAGCIFLLTAISFAELSSTFPTGGAASWARYAFGNLSSFFTSWGVLLDFIVVIAIAGFAVPAYLIAFCQLMGMSSSWIGSTAAHLLFTLAVIFALFVINFLGVKLSTRLSWVLTIMAMLTEFFIIVVAALFLISIPEIIHHLKIGGADVNWSPSWLRFCEGTGMAMVAFTGLASIGGLSPEAKNPALVLPKAILRVACALIAVYIGISCAALSAITPQELSTIYLHDPIVGIVLYFPFGMGQWLAPWVSLIAAMLLLVACNAGFIGASRLAFSMGSLNLLPRFFHPLNPRHLTPSVCLILLALIAAGIVLVSRGQMTFLANLYNFGAMIAYSSAHMSLMKLRLTRPDVYRPFRAPFNIPVGRGRTLPITAMVGLLGTVSVWLLVVFTKPEGRYLGFAWMAVGLSIYYFYSRKKRPYPSVEKMEVPNPPSQRIQQILVTVAVPNKVEPLRMAYEAASQYQAQVTTIQIVEPTRPMAIEPLRDQAAAMAQDHQVATEVTVVESRAIPNTILDLMTEQAYDLVIIGVSRGQMAYLYPDRLLTKAPRVWFLIY